MKQKDAFVLFKLGRLGQIVFFVPLVLSYLLDNFLPVYLVLITGLLCFASFTITIFWKCKNCRKAFCGAYSPFITQCIHCGKSMTEISQLYGRSLPKKVPETS